MLVAHQYYKGNCRPRNLSFRIRCRNIELWLETNCLLKFPGLLQCFVKPELYSSFCFLKFIRILRDKGPDSFHLANYSAKLELF